jgi:hypothetical protein
MDCFALPLLLSLLLLWATVYIKVIGYAVPHLDPPKFPLKRGTLIPIPTPRCKLHGDVYKRSRVGEAGVRARGIVIT